MHEATKGDQSYFGMNAHIGMKTDIGVDAQSSLVHTVAGTAANVNALNMAGALLHGQEASRLRRRWLSGRAQAARSGPKRPGRPGTLRCALDCAADSTHSSSPISWLSEWRR